MSKETGDRTAANLDLLWRDVAMVIQGVKPFTERLLALRTVIPLATIESFTMFVRAGMTTE
jgi:hypothetical protein